MRIEIDGGGADELDVVCGCCVGEFGNVDAPVVEIFVLLEVQNGANIVLAGEVCDVSSSARLRSNDDVLTDVVIVEACACEIEEKGGKKFEKSSREKVTERLA